MAIQGLTINPNSGSTTSGTSIAISASPNTGTAARDPKLVTVSAEGGNSVILTINLNSSPMALTTNATLIDWGEVSTTTTKTLTGTSNAEKLTFSFSGSTTNFFNAKNKTTLGVPQFTVTPNGGSAITCTSGVNISGNPGANATYTWSIELVNVKFSSLLEDDAHGGVTVVSEMSSGSPITKNVSLNQLMSAWVKVNNATSAVTVTLNAGGTNTGTAPSVSSNTTWSIS